MSKTTNILKGSETPASPQKESKGRNPDSSISESRSYSVHTPGPWYAIKDKVQKDYGDKAFVIAAVNDHEEKYADARLIAAAPEQYESLIKLVTRLERTLKIARGLGTLFRAEAADELNEARAAIAKAEGN